MLVSSSNSEALSFVKTVSDPQPVFCAGNSNLVGISFPTDGNLVSAV